MQKTAGNRRFSRKPQIFAEPENHRFLQKPVSPICCHPFGALLAQFGDPFKGILIFHHASNHEPTYGTSLVQAAIKNGKGKMAMPASRGGHIYPNT